MGNAFGMLGMIAAVMGVVALLDWLGRREYRRTHGDGEHRRT